MKRRGRKRKQGRRQPNGQPYRPPAELRDVVWQARVRIYGVTEEQAREMPGTELLSAWMVKGNLTPRQWEAAGSYFTLDYDRNRVMAGGLTYPPSSEVERVRSYQRPETEAEIARYERLIAQWQRCRVAMVARMKETGDWRISHAVDAAVLRGFDPGTYIGSLREGLNVLADVFGIDKDNRGAQ